MKIRIILLALALSGAGFAASESTPLAGHRALMEARFADAERAFASQEAALRAQGAPEVDGAVYWQAYAAHRAGRHRSAEFLARRLLREFPESPYADEARALLPRSALSRLGELPRQAADPERDDPALEALIAAGQSEPLMKLVEDAGQSMRNRQRAFFALGLVDVARAQAAALRLVDGRKSPLAVDAATWLAMQSQTQALMRQRYQRFPPVLRSALVKGWASVGDAASLRAAYDGERESGVRFALIDALGQVGQYDVLLAAAAGDNASDRHAALNGLAYGERSKELLRLLSAAPDDERRMEVIRSLGAAGGGDEVARAIAPYASSQHLPMRTASVDALAQMGASEMLLELLEHADTAVVQVSLLAAIERLRDPEISAQAKTIVAKTPTRE